MEENISEALMVLNRNPSFLQRQGGAVLWNLVLLSLLQNADLSSWCVLAQPRAEEIKAGMGSCPANPAQAQAEAGSAHPAVSYSTESNAPGSQQDQILPHCLGVSHCVELFSAQHPNLTSSDSPSRLLKLTVQWMAAVLMNLLSISSANHTLLLWT